MRSLLRTALPLLLLSVAAAAILGGGAWRAIVGHLDRTQQVRFADLAENLAALEAPSILSADGELNAVEAADAIAWLKASSPGVDFYILDLRGRIVAPEPASLALSSISLQPLRRFMDGRKLGQAHGTLFGDDPRDPGAPKVFSVALLPVRGEPAGYLYAVIENPLRDAATASMRRELVTSLGLRALLVAGVFGAVLVLLFHFTAKRPFTRLAEAVRGQLETRGISRPQAVPDGPTTQIEADLAALVEHLEGQEMDIESLARVRQEVLANFTHDLRTPIATVRGYLETLALSEGALSPKQRREYLEIALRHSERLSRLVDELLELSRLDRCEVAPRLERFRLGELIQDNIQRFRLRADQLGIRLEADFDPDMPPVFADVGLMERALENLIDNALRHSKTGDRVTVRLRHGGRRLLVSVIDAGVGIAPDDLPFVFDRFYRSRQQPQPGGDRRQGVGLGLAITRRIAELHGGQLLVESRLGVGSTFTFSLEVAPLTFQLSTADQLRFRPARWPPSLENEPGKARSGGPRVETGPIG